MQAESSITLFLFRGVSLIGDIDLGHKPIGVKSDARRKLPGLQAQGIPAGMVGRGIPLKQSAIPADKIVSIEQLGI